MKLRLLLSLALLSSYAAFAQATYDGFFAVRYLANIGPTSNVDSYVNITNTNAPFDDPPICVNVYTFSPDEQLISCCSCYVTPNALVSLSAKNDLVSNTLTPAIPNSVVVKLVSTLPVSPGTCNPASVPYITVNGLAAWATTG